MIRKIIKINKGRCDGCGLCVTACREGAIGLVDGKAVLLRDDYCDGLGNCLPVCPVNAISFEEREAAAFDGAAVMSNKNNRQPEVLACGCSGLEAKAIKRENCRAVTRETPAGTHLNQWPVQIKLAPPSAAYFDRADLLVAADCAAYAYGNFHGEFMKGKITIIGCPKLDEVDYSEKLSAIFKLNDIKSVTVVRMQVPCCGGLDSAAATALRGCGKAIPRQTVTISTDGKILK